MAENTSIYHNLVYSIICRQYCILDYALPFPATNHMIIFYVTKGMEQGLYENSLVRQTFRFFVINILLFQGIQAIDTIT
jgi:hypothetical protein